MRIIIATLMICITTTAVAASFGFMSGRFYNGTSSSGNFLITNTSVVLTTGGGDRLTP